MKKSRVVDLIAGSVAAVAFLLLVILSVARVQADSRYNKLVSRTISTQVQKVVAQNNSANNTTQNSTNSDSVDASTSVLTPAPMPSKAMTTTPRISFSPTQVNLNRMPDGSCQYSFATLATANNALSATFAFTLSMVAAPSDVSVANTSYTATPNLASYSYTAAGSLPLATGAYSLVPGASYTITFNSQATQASAQSADSGTGSFIVPSDCLR